MPLSSMDFGKVCGGVGVKGDSVWGVMYISCWGKKRFGEWLKAPAYMPLTITAQYHISHTHARLPTPSPPAPSLPLLPSPSSYHMIAYFTHRKANNTALSQTSPDTARLSSRFITTTIPHTLSLLLLVTTSDSLSPISPHNALSRTVNSSWQRHAFSTSRRWLTNFTALPLHGHVLTRLKLTEIHRLWMLIASREPSHHLSSIEDIDSRYVVWIVVTAAWESMPFSPVTINLILKCSNSPHTTA